MTWTDHDGLERTGELLDSLTFEHPKAGTTHAALYRVPALTDHNDEIITLEVVSSGKTHEFRVASESEGRNRMAQLRAQGVNHASR